MILICKHNLLSNWKCGGRGSGAPGLVEAGPANLEFEDGDKLTKYCGLKI